jgi:hypothetical protein
MKVLAKGYMKYLLILFMGLSLNAAIPDKFVRAVHFVESSGRLGPIRGKSGELGPLQITRPCWIDACKKNPSLRKKGFDECAKLDYSKKVMEAYFARYGASDLKANRLENLARLWNGGPSWRKNRYKTDKYWQKIKKAIK